MNNSISSESSDPSVSNTFFPVMPSSKNEKILKLSVVRTTVEIFQPTSYYISSEGVSHSLRQPSDGFFKIGRQQITENGSRPNDLMLPPSDRAISRSHCMIDYRDFFDSSPSDVWISFLMATHPRLGQNSQLQVLPPEIFRYILLFLKKPRMPLLIDLGSMCGTYVKISNTEPYELKQGMNFLVGSDINIEIDRVVNEPIPQSLNSEATIEDYSSTLQEFSPSVQEGPFVVVKVSKFFSDNDSTMHSATWKFLAEEKYRVVTIGRSQVCDINLPENTISRIQCRVIYRDGRWVLLDGSDNKPTVNGTWLSVCKRNNLMREWSEPYPLKPSCQIKISDTIIQVDYD